MRRVILAILGIIFTAGLCMAQRTPLTQRGMATQEMTTEGLAAAHPSIPIGSKAKVTNIANGKEVEVTITGRISPSATRVVDLSPGAALALDIGFGGPVIINQILATRKPREEPPPPPPPEPEPEPEPVIIVEAPPPPPPPPPEPPPPPPPSPPPQQPVNITIFNYITPPDPPPTPPPPPPPERNDLEYLSWLGLLALDRKDPAPEPPPPTYTPPPPQPAPPPPSPPPSPPPAPPPPQPQYIPQYIIPQYVAPVVPYCPPPLINEVQVIPGFPDPNNGRIYRLQVGSFYSEAGAALAYQQLVSAGFYATWEYSFNAYRVLANGIPASAVYATIYRLGAMGFRQIWVRD